jgi:hypothetical protein
LDFKVLKALLMWMELEDLLDLLVLTLKVLMVLLDPQE